MLMWDWPGDDREDRAKRVALAYRQLLLQVAYGEVCDATAALAACDEYWLDRGQHWVSPAIDPYDPDDWITANDAAHYTGYEPTTIRKWAELKRKGNDGITEKIGPDGRPRYNIGDIRLYDARRRQRRRTRQITANGGVVTR